MKNIIEVKNLSFTYKEEKEPALNNVSFTIPENSWISIVGHNGSGKSTLSRLLNGLLLPSNESAKITIDGIQLNEDTVWQIRDKIGIVFQNPDNQFVGTSVQDDIAFGLENRNIPRDEMKKRVLEVVKQVNMENFLNSEPQLLSGGQKQRVAIAGILAIQPKIIILDEATSMLDPAGRKSIISLLRKIKKEKKITVLSITHHVNEVLDSDRVLILKDGNLIKDDTPEAVFQNNALVEDAGLSLPFIFKLKRKLKENNIDVPDGITTKEEMVNWLCRSNLKM